jgi:hypothetical protein
MIEGDILVDEDIGVFDERPLVAVLEVMAVFVGGEGRRSFIGLEEGDEFGGEAKRAGEGQGDVNKSLRNGPGVRKSALRSLEDLIEIIR